MADLKILAVKAINEYITKDHWKNSVKHAEQLQIEDAKLDIAADHFLDSLVITVSPNDSDSSEEDLS